MSGSQVTFIGDAMAAVVQGVEEVRSLIGQPPVVVGGLAVMCRLLIPTAPPPISTSLTGYSAKCHSFKCSALQKERSLFRQPRCC